MSNDNHLQKPIIRIAYIHDVICSWCPIGLRHVDRAMASLNSEIDFELKFLPFELNPAMPPEGETIPDYFRRRSGWSAETFARYVQSVVETAASVDLVYDYAKRTHYYNTAKAHRLIDFAESSGMQKIVVDRLTRQYFEDGVNIARTEALVEIAESVGLNGSLAHDALNAPTRSETLESKYEQVRGLPVKSTPSLLINDELLIQGSNSTDFFKTTFASIARGQFEPKFKQHGTIPV